MLTQEEFETKRNTLEEEAAQDCLKVVMLTMLKAGPSWSESFMDWLMAGVAGAIALLISNAEKLSDIIEPSHFQWCLRLFVLSLIVGAITKYLASEEQTSSQNAAGTAESIKNGVYDVEKFKALAREGATAGLDVKFLASGVTDKLKKQVASAVPIPYRWIYRFSNYRSQRREEKNEEDPLRVLKKRFRRFWFRNALSGASFGLAVSGVALAAYSTGSTIGKAPVLEKAVPASVRSNPSVAASRVLTPAPASTVIRPTQPIVSTRH
jgi:hypothetical protein